MYYIIISKEMAYLEMLLVIVIFEQKKTNLNSTTNPQLLKSGIVIGEVIIWSSTK